MSEPCGTILHVDLDAFFVSMEVLRRPELRGLPVVVAGGLGGRGVVNTCSYEARRFGVRSAMPVAQAQRLCPRAVYLESDYAYYATASRAFHAILAGYTPLTEPAGADEAYLDVHGTELLFGDSAAIAREIRRRVRAEIGITASVGVSTNKLVAKVASDAGKPDGLVAVAPGGEAAFLAPRPVRDLPMVGPRTAATLEGLGVHTIGDLAAVPVRLLAERFGSHGAELHERALGRFEVPVLAGRGVAKSVSRETTFDRDEADGKRLRGILRAQCDRVAADLARQGRGARTVALKLRFPPFETVSRSETRAAGFVSGDSIFSSALGLFTRAWQDHGQRPVRLIGVGAANLTGRSRQLALGETLGADRLEHTLGALRERYGEAAVRRGAELSWGAAPNAGDGVDRVEGHREDHP